MADVNKGYGGHNRWRDATGHTKTQLQLPHSHLEAVVEFIVAVHLVLQRRCHLNCRIAVGSTRFRCWRSVPVPGRRS